MEKKIVILGRIGNTVFQNNDSAKVLHRGGVTKCVRTMEINTPMVVRRMRRKLYSKDDQHIIYRRKMLCFRRTEYGKQIRKSYENHRIYEKRSNIQKLEPSDDGIAHCITTVLKDSMYVGKVSKVEEKNLNNYLYTDDSGEQYGIFKLSPRECLRLMNVRDTDIDKMQEVNSNTQCYKQAGNSIVVSVLCGIFSQLGISGVKKWNDMTNDERYEIIKPGEQCE